MGGRAVLEGPRQEGREERTPVHVRVGVEAMEGLLRKLDAIQGQMDRLQ